MIPSERVHYWSIIILLLNITWQTNIMIFIYLTGKFGWRVMVMISLVTWLLEWWHYSSVWWLYGINLYLFVGLYGGSRRGCGAGARGIALDVYRMYIVGLTQTCSEDQWESLSLSLSVVYNLCSSELHLSLLSVL